jgi:hypothetical protein
MIYRGKKLEEILDIIDKDRIFYGEGRTETGICLHVPLKQEKYIVGSAIGEDYEAVIGMTNSLIEFLKYKRYAKGPEDWDYDNDKATEVYEVCGDNPNQSGIIIFDKNYKGSPKIQIFLDKTFGSNEFAIKWKNDLVGDETALDDIMNYIKNPEKYNLKNSEEKDK